MKLISKHINRDKYLSSKRDELLRNALSDLTADPKVLAIYSRIMITSQISICM